MRGALGVPDEVVVDLAGAQHQPRDLLVLHARLGEHRLEARALGHVRDRARRLRQAQQRLRRHHHERALLGDARLAAQQVEVLGRRRRARDADVALGGRAQEALQARRGVLRARALVAVGQQQRQARGLAPLGQAGDDELVDDHLRGVDEVAELRLPQHERLRAPPGCSRTRSPCTRAPTAGCCAAPAEPAPPAGSGSGTPSGRSSRRAGPCGAG